MKRNIIQAGYYGHPVSDRSTDITAEELESAEMKKFYVKAVVGVLTFFTGILVLAIWMSNNPGNSYI
jgi:hypothetical protein